MNIALLVLHVLLSLGIIAVILLQSGRAAGLGSIAGAGEVFFGKRRGLDALLGRLTTFVAIGFLVTSLLLSIFPPF